MKRETGKILAVMIVFLLLLSIGCEAAAVKMLPPTQYDTDNPLTVEQMRQDLDFLEAWLAENHVNAWHSISKVTFHSELEKVKSRLDGMTRTQFEYEILKLVALIGDAHTAASLGRLYTGNRREFTFEAMSFDDGWYITKIDKEHGAYLGCRIDQINGFDRKQITKMVVPYISTETDAWTQYEMSKYINNWDILYLAGVVDTEAVPLTLSKDGKIEEVLFTSMQHAEAYDLDYITLLTHDEYKEIETGITNEYYRYIEYDDLLFVQYNVCKNTANNNMTHFVAKLDEKQSEKNYKNIVVDLRYNSGGNSDVIDPLMTFIADFVHAGGKAYVLIGEMTFSSGIWAMVDLQPYATAVLGKPTGGGVNHFGDVKAAVTLENSGIYIGCSTRWIQKTKEPGVASGQPDITVKHTFEDYFNGIDPELAAVRELISDQ